MEELTIQEIDKATEFLLNSDIKTYTCAKCGKEFSQGYSTYECDECFFSRFPKKDVECFCKRFLD